MAEKLDTRLSEATRDLTTDAPEAADMTSEVRAAVAEDIRIGRQQIREGEIVQGEELDARLARLKR